MKPLLFSAAMFCSFLLSAQKQDTIRYPDGSMEIVTVIEIPPAAASSKDTVIATKQKNISGIDTSEVFSYCRIPPRFPGGEAAYFEYIRNNSRLKAAAGMNGSAVYVNFIVERNGSISNVKIMKEIKGADAYNQEAVRLIRSMPRWTPGKIDSQTIVRASITMPVSFPQP